MTKDNKNSPSANGSGAPGGSRHPEYYIRGADLYIRTLDNTQFRVHSYFFLRESGFWKDKLAGATHPGDIPLKTGGSEKDEVFLDDEKTEDFERFLKVFYNPKYDSYDMSSDDWVIILKYARKWQFQEVMDLAIRYLELAEIDLIKRIRLYQENEVPKKYLFPLYIDLASREEVLRLEESRDLGLETSVLIYQARERLRVQRSDGDNLRSPIHPSHGQAEIIDIVGSAFKIPAEERVLPKESDTEAKHGQAHGSSRNPQQRKRGGGPK